MPSAKEIEYKISDNGCWICTSHKPNQKGYIDICRDGRRTKLHRYMLEKELGIVIDRHLVVMHQCDTPSCINPSHLLVGTVADNNSDKINKGRHSKGEELSISKLTEEDVKNIFSDDRSSRVIANDYGIEKTQVLRIKNGRSWRHVTEELC
jgi:hypothetical protein